MASNLELIKGVVMENRNNTSTDDDQPGLMMDVFCNGSFFEHHQQPHHHQLCMMSFADNNNIQTHDEALTIPSLLGSTTIDLFSHGKAMPVVDSFLNLSPPPVSETGMQSLMSGRKRKRNNEKAVVVEKPKEVIHVRAKRGQATDSHSLAERVRREKINERLRCLQDLVPGCYKTMGMAVMLDVIINYIRSLQNQIEFLSMKLSAASMYYDFNSELDAIETTMPGTNECEAQDKERMVGEEGHGGPSYFHSTWSL